jgi:hypothetical protein
MDGPFFIHADSAVAPVTVYRDSTNANDPGEAQIGYAEFVAHAAAADDTKLLGSLLRARQEIQTLVDRGVSREKAEGEVIALYERSVRRASQRMLDKKVVTAEQLKDLEEFQLRDLPSAGPPQRPNGADLPRPAEKAENAPRNVGESLPSVLLADSPDPQGYPGSPGAGLPRPGRGSVSRA